MTNKAKKEIEIKDRKVRLLSLDGGGIKGVLSGQILVRVEELLKEITGDPTTRLGDYFDIIAGTSTGGILACAYLMPDGINRPIYSAEEVVGLYLKHGGEIFHKPFWQKVKSGWGFWGPEYSDKGLNESLDKYFGKTELKDLIKPCLVTALDTETRKCVFFKQHYAKHEDSENFFVKDAVRGTSSAPTYFKPARIKSMSGEEYSLVDGGLFANNPTLCAYTEVNKIFKTERNLTVKDVKILSIGTGKNDISYPYDKIKKWGIVPWAKPAIDMMMGSASQVAHYEMGKLYESFRCEEQYLRINPLISYELTPIDDASEENMKKLQDTADITFEKLREKIKHFLEL